MKATLNYTANGRDMSATCDLPDSEQGFWREVSSLLPSLDVPSTFKVMTDSGDAEFDVTARGTFMRDGEEVPSMFIVPLHNHIDLAPSIYEDAYLTCINPETRGGRGNYKFYRLSQKPDGSVTAFYGRIGQSRGFGAEREIKEPMPSWMFEVRKAEKIAKGYVDRSDAFCQGDTRVASDAEHKSASDPHDLYQKLLAFAEKRVTSSLVAGAKVTTAQVGECEKLLKRIGRCSKVESFNERLLDLMSLSPRNVSSVSAELARDQSDFPRIISREESLVAAMRAVADSERGMRGADVFDGFAKAGVSWRELGEGETEEAAAHVPASLRGKVKRVYRVDSEGQRKRFENYLAERGMTGSDVRLMWHGSRNENWCSIVAHSLMLNPNAQITGKMFGHGIYFGYDNRDNGALKSWNYTSARGSYWANGSSDTAFMGLYECAYGNPHSPSRVSSFDKSWLDGHGYDCVHARGGNCGLMHDEVVFYDEAAVCIKYLFEFAA